MGFVVSNQLSHPSSHCGFNREISYHQVLADMVVFFWTDCLISCTIHVMSRNVEVRKSPIDGKGMFAKKDFKKGQTVFLFKGRVYRRVNKNSKHAYMNPNSIGYGPNMWIDPIGKFPYINHSCNPNMGIKGRVTFVALRNIKKGEELTFDYSIIESDLRWKMKNLEKKTKGFRLWIGPIQSLPLKVYKSYLPYIPKYFQKVYNNYHNLDLHAKKR